MVLEIIGGDVIELLGIGIHRRKPQDLPVLVDTNYFTASRVVWCNHFRGDGKSNDSNKALVLAASHSRQ